MANEVTTQKPRFSVALTEELNLQRDALPRDFNITRFVNNSIALLNGNETLAKFAKQYGTDQIKMGLMRGAYLGLDALNNEMYLVPYGSTLNFMPSYTGMQKLCMRYSTRPIKSLYAKVVREGDEFSEEIVNGEPSVTFKPKAFNNGKIVGAFAVCLYKDGGMVYEVMSLQELEQCRRSSKAKNSPAWDRFTQMMYRKTVLRRLTKAVPIDMDDKLADAMNAGLEIETDPAKIAEREAAENGSVEELVVESEVVG
jgi:recombination protein RecT